MVGRPPPTPRRLLLRTAIAVTRVPDDLLDVWFKLSEDAVQDTANAASALARDMMAVGVGATGRPPNTSGSGEWIEGQGGGAGPLSRRYRLFVPDRKLEAALPLVVLLHGCGQDSAAMVAVSRAAAHARHKGFAVLAPEQPIEANPQRCWNWFGHEAVVMQEVEALSALVDGVCEAHALDRERVFLTGISAGGAMAMALGLHHPERFAAICGHSCPVPLQSASGGALMSQQTIAERLGSRALPPLLLIHGDIDPVVVPANADACAALWLSLSGADPMAAAQEQVLQRDDRRRYTQRDWPDGPSALRLIRVHGLGHAWSGGAQGQAFSDPSGPDALRLAWEFFLAQR